MRAKLIGMAAVIAATCGSLTAPAVHAGGTGAYLAARQAAFKSDYRAASNYFARALLHDSSNADLLENFVIVQGSLGRYPAAATVAKRLLEAKPESQAARIALLVGAGLNDDYEAIVAQIADEKGVGALVDGLLTAWSYMGQGAHEKAMAQFDQVAAQRGLKGFALYHKALAYAMNGELEKAEEIFAGPNGSAVRATRRAVMVHARLLSALGRNEEAAKVITESFGEPLDPGLKALHARLLAGERLRFNHVTTARDGMAEVFYSVAKVLSNEASGDYILIFSRAAEALNPKHTEAVILSAGLLETLGQFELAENAYRKIPKGSQGYHAAVLGRAEALRRSGDTEGAIEALRALTLSHDELPLAHSTLGDLMRSLERFDEAVAAYDQAVALYEKLGGAEWFVYYARGISQERLGNWTKAEADFREALKLRPDQPQVLNYLGYSLVEKKIKLDEALDMIRTAAEARPESGYIIDSLGWVLYRLGRYPEAVPHMERAAELMPVDPVVNDHLGDVYWAVGRRLEARFQWKRALSFVDKDDPNPEAKPERIRRKLELGLDEVLSEEGAPPLHLVAKGG